MRRPLPLAFLAFALAALAACDAGDEGGLPPDPGEAGERTLEGVDTDGDGLRDDVQRLIYQEYDAPPVREALTSFARVAQEGLVGAAAGADARALAGEMRRSLDCLWAADPDDATAALAAVESALANTYDRSRAYLELNDQFNGTFQRAEPSAADHCARRGETEAEGRAAARAAGPRAAVVFSNGMFTSYPDAVLSTRVLENTLRRQGALPSGLTDVEYHTAYNQNELATQFFEVAYQSFGATYGTLLGLLAGSRATPSWFDRWLGREVALIGEMDYVLDADLQSQVQTYRTLLDGGRKVVIVAHSQGNFYANRACRRIGSPSLGVVGVGTPASQVCDAFQPYTTNRNDVVIAGFVRGSNWTVLPPTTDDALGGTALGHDFLRDYLYGDNSGPRIIGHVRTMLQSLPQPEVTVGSGPITVTLEWGEQRDLDLHVFEPDGTHVFYGNLRGGSGELDRDDTNQYGPENYYVPLATLREGVYWIGVNYYGGEAPATASVQVSTAGTTHPAVFRTLSRARGPAGDPSPTPVAEVEVRRQGNRFRLPIPAGTKRTRRRRLRTRARPQRQRRNARHYVWTAPR